MSLINWTPQEEALNSVVDVLRESFVPDTGIQKTVQQKIALLYNCPDFINYLLYIVTKSELYGEDVRAIGCIILKNNIYVTYDNLQTDSTNLLKNELLNVLKDKSRDVRVSVSAIINAVVSKGGLSNWPELIPYLSELVNSTDKNICESALITLFKICEDHLSGLDDRYLNESIKDLLLKFTNLVISDGLLIRLNAIKLLNIALQEHYDSIKNEFDSSSYLTKLFVIMDDESVEVQKLVCQAFVAFLDNKDAAILPHMFYIIEIMLRKTQHNENDVALQACEFWYSCTKLPNCRNLLKPFIDQLLPMLLNNMRYSEYELNNLKDLFNNDTHLQDKSDDIRPFTMQYRDDVDYDFMDATDVGWTLRKCSAASLDALSLKMREDMLPTLLKSINDSLTCDDILRREAAILALGAVAEGCMESLKPYLNDLINYLMNCLKENNSMIRVITCWSISRYMRWIVSQSSDDLFFTPIMIILMKHFLDANKRVQRAALSAFCVLEEDAGLKLVPYIDIILQAFLEALNQCKFRSFYLLYDAIGVLSQSVGTCLANFADILMPHLMTKFNSFNDYFDDQFLALLDCLSNVVTAIEVRFLPYAEEVYNRCLCIINETLQAVVHYAEKPDDYELPDKEPMCGAQDMILAMAIGMKTYFVKYAINSNLIRQLYYTMQDVMPQIRQSALAIYGELIRLCFHYLNDIQDYISIIIENLDKRYEGVCNNAAWVIGKLCTASDNCIVPYVSQIMEHFIEIMQDSHASKTVYQTVAISMCTLGYVCPTEVAPHLPLILQSACRAMRNVRDCEEKELGFRGLCELIYHNPSALPNDFIYFCDAVASWNNVAIDLRAKIQNILFTFKDQCNNDWSQVYDQFPPLLKFRLNNLYGI